MVAGLHPVVGADGTFCLCLKVGNKVVFAKVQPGVPLEDNRTAPAFVAPHCFVR
jgi:hypothetical protein